MPKCELHAHLTGSVKGSLAVQLVQLHREHLPRRAPPSIPPMWSEATTSSSSRSGQRGHHDLEVAFGIFPLVQRLTEFPEALREAVRGVVTDFQRDGVRFVEIEIALFCMNAQRM